MRGNGSVPIMLRCCIVSAGMGVHYKHVYGGRVGKCPGLPLKFPPLGCCWSFMGGVGGIRGNTDSLSDMLLVR